MAQGLVKSSLCGCRLLPNPDGPPRSANLGSKSIKPARCKTDVTVQLPQATLVSTGGRNTLIFRKIWGVLNEVSSADLLFS